MFSKKVENNYYTLDEIKKYHATYNLVFGKRGNGKTYAGLMEILKNYVKNGKQSAYLRRMKTDFTAKTTNQLFAGLVANNEISKLTKGAYTDVYYRSGCWYLCKYEETDEKEPKRIIDKNPFCFAFALSSMEHDKSVSYPNITLIVFDEFLTRSIYLNDEFVIFMNVLSTIIRDRTDVVIYMLANTVSQDSPYFREMYLTEIIRKMSPNEIKLVEQDGVTIALHYVDSNSNTKSTDSFKKYFDFKNPRLQMISAGKWEIDCYPHRPVAYKPKDVVFRYFIDYEIDKLMCEVVITDECTFTYVTRKTGDFKSDDIIFSPKYDARPNHIRRITDPLNKIARKLYKYYQQEQFYYQDNEVGEIIRNYVNWCKTSDNNKIMGGLI